MVDDPFDGFETARLRLRCLRDADAPAIAALMTPAVSATLASWPSPMDEEAARERIAMSRAAAAEGTQLPLAMLLRGEGILVGYVGLALIDPDRARCAKLGYWVGEPYQGRGYAREAAAAAVAAARALLGAAEVEGAVEVGNPASAAVLRALGLQPADRRMMPARGGEHLCDIYRGPAPA